MTPNSPWWTLRTRPLLSGALEHFAACPTVSRAHRGVSLPVVMPTPTFSVDPDPKKPCKGGFFSFHGAAPTSLQKRKGGPSWGVCIVVQIPVPVGPQLAPPLCWDALL